MTQSRAELEDKHTRQAALCKTELVRLQHHLIWVLWNVAEVNHLCGELVNHVVFDVTLLVHTAAAARVAALQGTPPAFNVMVSTPPHFLRGEAGQCGSAL
jgi:hypothetical protein